MEFTALHRLLGRPPGPLTDEMLEDAVAQGIAETDDLDWKKPPPEERDLAQSDTLKDIAAMANLGGGLIIFGVDEEQKKATDRVDVGDVTESYERTLRRVAVSGIHPPVFNLGVHRLGVEPRRALVVEVPASLDVPHLIYRGTYFGAPIRNNADTEWMRERQLESMYRTRLDDRRNAGEALNRL
jgi:predicted HTH transcriptional regulator